MSKAVPPRKLSESMRQTVRKEIQDLLDKGIIRESTSNWAAPIVMVKKPDKSWRMCVDYKVLNSHTVNMKYPLQNMKDLINRLAGQTIYATLDLRSGYHQIPLAEESMKLTAFVVPDGMYEYTRMPFGLKNAPSFFQKVMNDVLKDIVGNGCEVFIDDIVVYGKTTEEFFGILKKVFGRLRQHNLKLKREKCHIGLSQIEYVGHVVNSGGVTMSQARREALMKIPTPTTRETLHSWIGFANFFREFVQDFSSMSKPLTGLLSKKNEFKWTEEHQTAFEKLRDACANCPLLAFVDYTKELYLRTDASKVGIGGMLFQYDNNKKVLPISFVSKSFDKTQMNWSTIEQEAYAIYYCVNKLDHYLRGHAFILETDHRNLVWMGKSSTPKVIRWRLNLSDFDYEIKHIKGIDNKVADGLSRLFAINTSLSHVPQIEKFHNAIVGHRGIAVTVEMLKQNGHTWKNMTEDVREYIASCATCQKVRLGQGSMAAALHTTSVEQPFETVAIDTIGPLPKDDEGNKYILVAIDCFTRFVELKACKDATAKSAAKFLLELFGRCGAPKELRSDQGTQFLASVVQEFLTFLNVSQRCTLPYRPQANGTVERANGEVMRHLRAIAFDKRVVQEWSTYLPLVQRIINVTPHSAIGCAPARMRYGDQVNLDRELVSSKDGGRVERYSVEDYIQKMNEAQKRIIEASKAHQNDIVRKYLSKSPENPTSFKEGDYVCVSYPGRSPSKLHPRWRGPMIVAEVHDNTYVCQDLTTLKLLKFDISRLKLFNLKCGDDAVDIASKDHGEYVVDKIIDHQHGPDKNKSSMKFLVRWKGYEPDEDTWEPYEHVKDCEALDEYVKNHPDLHSKGG